MSSDITNDIVTGFVIGYLSCAQDHELPARKKESLLKALRVTWPLEDEKILQKKLLHVLSELTVSGQVKRKKLF